MPSRLRTAASGISPTCAGRLVPLTRAAQPPRKPQSPLSPILGPNRSPMKRRDSPLKNLPDLPLRHRGEPTMLVHCQTATVTTERWWRECLLREVSASEKQVLLAMCCLHHNQQMPKNFHKVKNIVDTLNTTPVKIDEQALFSSFTRLAELGILEISRCVPVGSSTFNKSRKPAPDLFALYVPVKFPAYKLFLEMVQTKVVTLHLEIYNNFVLVCKLNSTAGAV
eukprot:GHVT01040701.1.p1 GENE.GHVT01040701.1~~GHVT01040701.1.p1  ORF type:complete len:224 (+),score=34.56 GHVT01040701.1:1078-1749(+)